MAGQADSLKSVLFALFANTAIAIAKGIAALVTGSGAMLAEAIHSVADAGNQLLLILGLRQTHKAPTEDHPLGFGKSIYFWSFLVAVILFSLGGMFSLYEGIHKLLHPEPLTYPWVAIAVLLFAIGAESVSLWGCLREVNKEKLERSFLQWFRQSRSSALIVVLGEDVAALLGLVFALAAILGTIVTGNPMWDALGTVSIGALLLIIAVFVAVKVKDLLIGQSVDPTILVEMRRFFERRSEIRELYSVLTMQFGPDAMVAVKAKMVPTGSERGMIAAINLVEHEFRARFPMTAWLFFEPDVED
jgi:cation diffusion facilitator family transporter